jgi:tetratricopeptide (TPR) repeat protein
METNTLPDIYELWDYYDPAKTEERFLRLWEETAESDQAAYRAELLTQIARSQGLQRRFADAHKTLDQAAAMLPADAHQAKVRLFLERGRVVNSSGDKAGSIPFFTEAYTLARAYHLESLEVDAAHMMGIVESPEVALDWNELAIEAAERSADPQARRWLGSLCNNTAWTLHDMREYQPAMILFEKALAFRKEQNQPVETRIAQWSIARCHRSMGHIDEALQRQRQLEAEYAELGERSGFVFEEIAECLLAKGRPEEAKPYFAQAYEELCKDNWIVEDQPKRLARIKQLAGL